MKHSYMVHLRLPEIDSLEKQKQLLSIPVFEMQK